jgi:hypothetical protein
MASAKSGNSEESSLFCSGKWSSAMFSFPDLVQEKSKTNIKRNKTTPLFTRIS